MIMHTACVHQIIEKHSTSGGLGILQPAAQLTCSAAKQSESHCKDCSHCTHSGCTLSPISAQVSAHLAPDTLAAPLPSGSPRVLGLEAGGHGLGSWGCRIGWAVHQLAHGDGVNNGWLSKDVMPHVLKHMPRAVPAGQRTTAMNPMPFTGLCMASIKTDACLARACSQEAAQKRRRLTCPARCARSSCADQCRSCGGGPVCVLTRPQTLHSRAHAALEEAAPAPSGTSGSKPALCAADECAGLGACPGYLFGGGQDMVAWCCKQQASAAVQVAGGCSSMHLL